MTSGVVFCGRMGAFGTGHRGATTSTRLTGCHSNSLRSQDSHGKLLGPRCRLEGQVIVTAGAQAEWQPC